MGGYKPLYIKKNETGLVQNRQEFILPDDAYPILDNAIIWREQIRRKQGFTNILPGSPASSRLQRKITAAAFGNVSAGGAGTFTFNIISGLILAGSITAGESNAQLTPGGAANTITIVIAGQTLTDTTGTGTMTIAPAGVITSATLSYATGNLILTFSGPLVATPSTFTGFYYPGLPVMGLRLEENQNSGFDTTVAFDTTYAYIYSTATKTWKEFLPGTTWTGSNGQFFWSTNFFYSAAGIKIFWVTNNNSTDPIRYTDGQPASTWFNFAPQIDAVGTTLTQCLAMLPFRGRMVAFNTTETGANGGTFTNRIRWAAIGTPFTNVSTIITSVNANAWRDDIRGQGGFLDIPTSEDITAVGFVRDNVVIYCERSTWQLRYTGQAIAPFQIERVNAELGARSLFSAVQFDTSLVGIGDKGIVECDSFKSNLIDIKIPNLVFEFSTNPDSVGRVHGIRDFISRMAFFTYVSDEATNIFPDKRLAYNYDNDSWGIYDDSFTCFGTFQIGDDTTWLDIEDPWVECNFPWINDAAGLPSNVAGNQQGFVEVLATQLQGFTTNDASLTINAITGQTPLPTLITSVNHNLKTGQIIKIDGLPAGDPFVSMNGQVFLVDVQDSNTFLLQSYNSTTGQFSDPRLDSPSSGYIGPGYITVRDNFNVVSKKFNMVDLGQSIQMGYVDILADATVAGAFTMNIYVDYDDDQIINAPNQAPDVDSFFNITVPTSQAPGSGILGDKFWQRIYCAARGNFLTIQYTLSNAQMAGNEQLNDVEIDAQVLWLRPAGRLTQTF